MDFTGVFTYNNEYLIVEPQNALIVIAVAGLFLVATLVVRFLFLAVSGFFLILKERKMLETRKKTLSDLVLMKDIQTELEKEIEQATLRAAFQT